MYQTISVLIVKLASLIASESHYINIPYYQQRIEPEEDSREVGDGPPSMYNDYDRDDRIKNKEDVRRQEERPEREWWYHNYLPVTVTNIGGCFENEQGEPMNDSTTTEGLNENKDTIGFDPDVLIENPFRC